MALLPSQKTNIESKGPTALTEIVSADSNLTRMARASEDTFPFWNEMESNYIFSHDQFRHTVEWMTANVATSGDFT